MIATQPSPEAVTFDVRAGARNYTVEIASGRAAQVAAALDTAGLPRRRFIVSNTTIWRLYADLFRTITSEEPILLPDGERYKNLRTTGRVYEALIRAGADRATTIVAIGGGVVGDIAGFAAATYLRGVPVVQVPTTLLAQVDSSIGGKVGVNHALGKNLIGAIHPPARVIIDIDLLASLPRREFRAGLYEVVKYGVIASRALFDRVAGTLPALFARDPQALVPVIAECCRIKARIVEQDERESGLRRTLNFGHTIGHALEAATKYRRFRHGEAVGYGMLVAAELAATRGALRVEDRDALAALVMQMGPLPPVADISVPQILEAAGRDKKVIDGRLHFVLPTSIGTTEVVGDVGMDELTRALAALQPQT